MRRPARTWPPLLQLGRLAVGLAAIGALWWALSGAAQARDGRRGGVANDAPAPAVGPAVEPMIAPVGPPLAAEATAPVVGPAGYPLRRVPAGVYTIGCTPGQGPACDRAVAPPRAVQLRRDLLVGTVELSQGLYLGLMGANPARFVACGPSCPVERVSWLDAARLANALSAAEGLEPCYVISGDDVQWPQGVACAGYRLPTAAEWEVAARGGADLPFSGGARAAEVGWVDENSGLVSHPVGGLRPNGYGLYDMTGNVWEWVWDRVGPPPGAAGVEVDPTGPAEGPLRGLRGGGWYDPPRFAQLTTADGYRPETRSEMVGVRLVRTGR